MNFRNVSSILNLKTVERSPRRREAECEKMRQEVKRKSFPAVRTSSSGWISLHFFDFYYFVNLRFKFYLELFVVRRRFFIFIFGISHVEKERKKEIPRARVHRGKPHNEDEQERNGENMVLKV